MPVKISLITLFILLLGCAAPHDNPLDPKSEHYVPPVTVPEPEPIEFVMHVWSEHVSYRLFSTDLYQVQVEFSHPDQTVLLDTVWVTYNGEPSVVMDSISSDSWGHPFHWSYFGCGQQMDCAIGQPFNFVALDVRDSVYYSGPAYLFRVIGNVPATSEPDSQDVTGPHVTLEWPPFNANFAFGFRATVLDSLRRTTWTSPLLHSAQLLTQVPDSLANGNYEWTLTAVDSFGNSSRSKEAQFSVVFGALP